MDELRLGPSQTARVAADQAALVRGWQVGQVLRAQVLDSSAAGGALLNIAGRQVSAATDIFLPQGAWLSLRITGLGPTPTVRILEAPIRTREAPGRLERQTLALLPRQGGVATPLQALFQGGQSVNLLSLLGIQGGAEAAVIEELVLQGPPRSPEALQKAFLQSGLFFESGLAQQGARGLPLDLKALLFRLRNRVDRIQADRQLLGAGSAAQTLLAGLARDVEGALATITLNQLSAVQYAQQDAVYWVFHVPFRAREHVHAVTVAVGHGGTGADDNDEAREWKALLDLDLPALGHLEAEVFLRERRVSVVIYVEREETRQLLALSLPALSARLEAEALEVGVVRVHAGSRGTAVSDQPFHAGLYSKV